MTAIYDIDSTADVARDAGFVSLISSEAQKLIASSAIDNAVVGAPAGQQLVGANSSYHMRMACFAS